MPSITPDDLLQYRNVPVDIAADYIGKGKTFLYSGLQTGRLGFGSAVLYPGNTWGYHIPPKKLIEYQEGSLVDLPVELEQGLHELAKTKGYPKTRDLIVFILTQYLLGGRETYGRNNNLGSNGGTAVHRGTAE